MSHPAVAVRVPATSANLGPGFDAFGLALGLHDRVTVAVADSGLEVRIEGEGCRSVGRDEGNLMVRALRAGLDLVGGQPPGLAVTCANAIPHGRGLGSSAAAIVAGVVGARALAEADPGRDPAPLDDRGALALAAAIEGHPDNVAAALLGGFTVSWRDPEGYRAARLEVADTVTPVACIPDAQQSTHAARSLLPAEVPHAEAAFTAGRAALLVAALAGRTDLLLAATQDRLHQPYRLGAQPAGARLVERLRADGVAAVLSGSGPTVLALAVGTGQVEQVTAMAEAGWQVRVLPVDRGGATAAHLR